MTGSIPPLAADRIAMTYDDGRRSVPVIGEISFDLRPGEIVSIVGPSGCGKTTLLNILSGLLAPSAGEVRWHGEILSGMPPKVGYMLQQDYLFEWRTILENALLGAEIQNADMGKARERATSLLTRYGLGQFLHHLPRQLSGGEQQRVAIARAFVARPRILFADEPTGNLDRRTGLAIEDLLFGMDDARATTVVVVTHDERLAARCDRQLRLDAGRLLP